MARKLSEIIAHIRMVSANSNVDTTLIQTEDLEALCDAAEQPLKVKIGDEIYRAAEALGASPDLLAIVGSYGDTLDDQDILSALQHYNQTDKAMVEPKDRH